MNSHSHILSDNDYDTVFDNPNLNEPMSPIYGFPDDLIDDIESNIIDPTPATNIYSMATNVNISYHLDRYKIKLETELNAVSAKIDTSKSTKINKLHSENYVSIGLEYYIFMKEIFNKFKLDLLDTLYKLDKNNNTIIGEFVYYNWYVKDYSKASEYLFQLAQKGCDNYCHIMKNICEIHTNNIGEQYFRTLYHLNKSENVFISYMKYCSYYKDYILAKEIYNENKNKGYLQIDMSTYGDGSITNYMVYGSDNTFKKDDITNKYINKLNHPDFNKTGKCNICLENNVKLIPFDCTHYVCAQSCYPRVMIEKNKCPECRATVAF